MLAAAQRCIQCREAPHYSRSIFLRTCIHQIIAGGLGPVLDILNSHPPSPFSDPQELSLMVSASICPIEFRNSIAMNQQFLCIPTTERVPIHAILLIAVTFNLILLIASCQMRMSFVILRFLVAAVRHFY